MNFSDSEISKTMRTNKKLMMGNEAIARGLWEGGASYVTGYPGNPSSEIIETLLKYNQEEWFKAEWSINEIVALEAAAAFSFVGLKAAVTMKQNGLSVCSDFLTTVCLDRLPGGLLVVVCDDPGPLTSSNELDSRHYARMAQIPLLEPSSSQEAKDMAIYGLDLSQEYGLPVILRSVSRLSHGRGPVSLDREVDRGKPGRFNLGSPMVGLPFRVTKNHARILGLMRKIQNRFNSSPFNQYVGPTDAETVVVASGLCALYASEAVSHLGLEDHVAVLKMGTIWPLPHKLITRFLKSSQHVIFCEEVDPFLEEAVKVVYAENAEKIGLTRFWGKREGLVAGPAGPGVGEMNTDIIKHALADLHKLELKPDQAIPNELLADASQLLAPRELAFCQGCPHRASFFAINSALALDAREGFVVGDIGCYGLAAGATGFNQIKALHCMGSGLGNSNGFSRLKEMGFEQPVLAVAGDSTFFHAGLPALANAVNHRADAVFIILDNSVTAMTGFQVNPATPSWFPGGTQTIKIEKVVEGMGAQVVVLDPVSELDRAISTILEKMNQAGVHVLVFRHPCATYAAKRLPTESHYKAVVDQSACLGDDCGCNRFCSRVISCPAIVFDAEKGVALIHDDLCTGCGLCVQICPNSSIKLVEQTGTPS
jgi:indolepyruvate ferredoxin oxidoreductase alpha subunit